MRNHRNCRRAFNRPLKWTTFFIKFKEKPGIRIRVDRGARPKAGWRERARLPIATLPQPRANWDEDMGGSPDLAVESRAQSASIHP